METLQQIVGRIQDGMEAKGVVDGAAICDLILDASSHAKFLQFESLRAETGNTAGVYRRLVHIAVLSTQPESLTVPPPPPGCVLRAPGCVLRAPAGDSCITQDSAVDTVFSKAKKTSEDKSADDVLEKLGVFSNEKADIDAEIDGNAKRRLDLKHKVKLLEEEIEVVDKADVALVAKVASIAAEVQSLNNALVSPCHAHCCVARD